MENLNKVVVEHFSPTPHMHGIRASRWAEMSSTLRVSYLTTLPFFHTVACLTNLLIFCIFSTASIKKYRASVFFRYLALVDAAQSCVMFGLMWLALAAPEKASPPAESHVHCRMYTILRYTMQDLSAYALVCLLMERCSAMSSKRSHRPSCVLLTLGRCQWLVRHLSSKIFLLTVTLLTLVINTSLVLAAHHDLEQPYITNCFNTWKSPDDFSYNFRSLAMNHALLSMVFPTLSCMVGYICLRILLNRCPLSSIQHMSNRLRHQSSGGASRQGYPVTRTRWIHLGSHPSAYPSTPIPGQVQMAPASGNQPFHPPAPAPVPPPLPLPPPPLTMMSVDEVESPEDQTPRRSCFLDRLYAMIKSREFVLSIVCVEDSRLTSLPPPDLAQEMNAMASIAAVFFILLVQPQLLLMLAGCILRSSYHTSMDWALVKNVGLAADLIFNNRISFTLFLFLFVSGRRMSTYLMEFFRQLFSCWCCLRCGSSSLWRRLQGRGQLLPQSRVRFFSPRRAMPVIREVTFLGRPFPEPRPEGGGLGGGPPASGRGEEGEGHAEVVPKVSIMTPS